jgi:hypothetical protein
MNREDVRAAVRKNPDEPRPLTEAELQAAIRLVEELRANLLQQSNVSAGSQILENTKRLVADVRLLRERLTSAREAMLQGLDGLESDDVTKRRAAFERMQDEFDGVPMPPEKPSDDAGR